MGGRLQTRQKNIPVRSNQPTQVDNFCHIFKMSEDYCVCVAGESTPVLLSRPDKSGHARISGHLWKIAWTPGECPDFCDFAQMFVI